MIRHAKAPCTILLLLLVATASSALDTDPRPFVPVQSGFSPRGTEVAPYAPDRLLVQFTPAAMRQARLDLPFALGAQAPGARTGLASVDAVLASAGIRTIERPYHRPQDAGLAAELGVDRWFLLRFDTSRDLAAVAAELARDPQVAAVSLDWVAFPATSPADPLYPDHWGHNNTAQLPGLDWGGTYAHTLPTTVGTPGFDANAEAAWDGSQGYGSASVVIAIIDSGVDVDHPDLRLVAGYDFGSNASNPDDNATGAGHGTCCAGVAAAVRNSLGSAGIAADCSIMPCKVANSQGTMYFSYIQNALYWAADHGAHIISMSLGAAISSDSATNTAIQYAYNAGCVILAATGNENASTISYPAINTYVIGVGAASPCGERKRSSSSSGEVNPGVNTDPNGYTCDGERWWGSNYGTTTAGAAGAVDVLAPTILPTTDILGSGGYRSGDYEPFFNGTSCATPYAAGVCALIKAKNPTWTNVQIRNQLVNTAQDVVSVESGAGWDRYAGYGMVDAAAAVGGGGGPVAPVAAFTGTPTTGDYPLAVAFTDQSTGSPTSWSWTFGDGGTSAAQNPSHTYTAAGSYTVILTATNAAGSDSETKTGYITVTEPGGATWTTITFDSFETNFGTFTDGGGDCTRYTGRTYAHAGRAAIDIQDNSGTASSFYHTAGYNVSGYSDLEVEFWFYAVSMESGEDFWVQYYDGSAWRTVATLARGTAFQNGAFYNRVVSIPRGTYNYPTNARLRFLCDASDNNDDVYIDEVEFRGLTAGKAQPEATPLAPLAFALGQNHPNPFNPSTTIAFSVPREARVQLRIFDLRGQVVATLVDGTLAAGEHQVQWDARRAPSGVYVYRLDAPGFTQTRKMSLLK